MNRRSSTQQAVRFALVVVLAGVLFFAASPSRAGTACDSIQKQLDGLKELKKETDDDLKKPRLTAAERARLNQQLKQVGQQIAATELALKKCLLDAASQPFLPLPAGAAPQRILEINYSNPSPNFDPSNPLWAGQLVNGPSFDPKHPKTYPKDVRREWTQVLAPKEDYDKFALVGASGWVVAPGFSSADVPFSHPFGFDWEFAMALDKPKNGPGPFDFLLAAGNKAPGGPLDKSEQKTFEERATNLGLSVPKGLLAVEMDGGNVPYIFTKDVKQGHRIATFGRWIVDAGHGNFATEIHPPLLMAAAGTNGKDSTRVLFTSRPYLASQIYTTDRSTAYNDAAADDGTFFQHLLQEIGKVIGVPILGIPESVLVEAHPKIKDHPFRGAHLLHLVIRPPSPANPLLAQQLLAQQLSVSFHFTVRKGCAVQVTSSARDTIDVFIALSDGDYHPPPLPAGSEKTYSRQELDALSKGAGTQILELDAIAGALALATGGPVNTAKVELILGRGIKTDTYAPVSGAVDILSADNAVRDVPANSIPAGKGVTQNENQPFPISGWLEVKWVRPGTVVR
jgi:hypothetical protein